jgi:inorganic pyrophosphatase
MLVEPDHLNIWDTNSAIANVIIETPKGSRNKFKYMPNRGQYRLCKVLPEGMVFPFDFGFLPSTVAPDGDPLDVLVLMEEPVFPGCIVQTRILGILEANQKESKKHVVRNDRLIGVAKQWEEHKETFSVKHLPKHLIQEIEHFFAAYHELDGHTFEPLAYRGPSKADKLIRAGIKEFQEQADSVGAAKAK